MPDDEGRCVWCGTDTGAGAIERPEPTPRLGFLHPPERAALFIGPLPERRAFCGCGGTRSEAGGQCWACRQAAGHRPKVPAGTQMPRCIDEETIQEARRLYASGLSIREVAYRIFERTTYASRRSCAQALFEHFARRGWKLRGRIAAVADSNRRRALPRPEPRRCAGVRSNAPRKGQRCRRAPLKGSDYCLGHDPAKRDEVVAHLADLRSRRAA